MDSVKANKLIFVLSLIGLIFVTALFPYTFVILGEQIDNQFNANKGETALTVIGIIVDAILFVFFGYQLMRFCVKPGGGERVEVVEVGSKG